MSRVCDPEPKMPKQSIIESQAAFGVFVQGVRTSYRKAIERRAQQGQVQVRRMWAGPLHLHAKCSAKRSQAFNDSGGMVVFEHHFATAVSMSSHLSATCILLATKRGRSPISPSRFKAWLR